eukprot:6203260-Pleurochrysis_carterae.AAC.1
MVGPVAGATPNCTYGITGCSDSRGHREEHWIALPVDRRLIPYSDSEWVVSNSTTGFRITYGGAAVAYGSTRQQCISLSSTEAEIVAASHTAAEVIYLRGLLRAKQGSRR